MKHMQVVRLYENRRVSGNTDVPAKGKIDAVTPDALLLKEMEETNAWARLGAQIYFGWFALILTINGVATGWLFAYKGQTPEFARLIFGTFILINLLAIVVTLWICKLMIDSHRRITDVIQSISQRSSEPALSAAALEVPRSGMSPQAIKVALGFTAAALIILLCFWIILPVWPQIVRGSP